MCCCRSFPAEQSTKVCLVLVWGERNPVSFTDGVLVNEGGGGTYQEPPFMGLSADFLLGTWFCSV